ncbi:MAG: SpoIIE family protein phosphatase [Anaerolineae bacterium]|nr:SpoIIE family protein phosphatase [Anaerolineae bacterium]
MRVAIAKRAFPGDPHCGDECAWWQSGREVTLCIVDGLGHGEHAERTARAAVEYVAGHLAQPLVDIFAGCDQALRRTRGAAMGIAVIDIGEGEDEEAGTLTYAGIGNTRAMIVREACPVVGLSSNYGIVGGGYRKLTPETVGLKPGDLVILTSDGIKEQCDILAYGDALRGDVQRLAEKILQDWGRETDDAAVLVFRNEVS